MRKEVWVGKKNLRFYYYHYRDSSYYASSIVIGTILACLILIFYAIIPQLGVWFSIQKEVAATEARIKTIESNIQYMSSIDKELLDKQLQIASTALPPEKDFGLVLNAVGDAAAQSGVSLQDFTFQVGRIGEVSKQVQENLPTITLSLVITGELEGIKRFVKELGQKVPLSEVQTIDGNVQSLSLKLQFYQKNFPKIVLKDDEPIKSVSQEKSELLQKLSSWIPAKSPVFESTPSSTESAVPLF